MSNPASSGNTIDSLIRHREEIAELRRQIRLTRTRNSLMWGFGATAALVVLCFAVATALTWREQDMLRPNLAGGIVAAVFAVLAVSAYYMPDGQGTVKHPVAKLKLQLELAEERRILEASRLSQPAYDRQFSYKDSMPKEIERLRNESRHYRRLHNLLQWTLILASAAIPAVAAVYDPPQPGKTILIALGAIVTVVTSVTGYFKFRERSFNLQQTADEIEKHATALELAIRPYNSTDDKNLEAFAENVETLRMEQRKREQQLDQPHEGRDQVV
ncbi:hypothetical protein GCM10027168_32360 [Streptomyces capparidis]